jgi:photosynthetic reaction center cytochrome c subunit
MRAGAKDLFARGFAGFLLGITVALALGAHADARPGPQGNPAGGNAAEGQKIFAARGCNRCHGMDAQGLSDAESSTAGPSIASTTISLTSFISYVRAPIDPMPAFDAAKISDAQLTDVYAFLQSKGAQTPATPASATASAPSSGNAVAGSGSKQPMAEDVFKNVTVLKGIPVSEFMGTMGFISDSLGESCEFCHAKDANWIDYADDSNPNKEITRKMLRMVFTIDKDNFGGRRVVTCYSCHNAADRPKVAPTIAGVYAAPVTSIDPDLAPVSATPDPGTPTVDQVLSKYITALGGAQKLAHLTSFTAKGKSVGYGEEAYIRPVEIYAQAPDKLDTIVHTDNGDNDTVYNGEGGWVLQPATAAPVPLLPLIAAELENAKMDTQIAFPANIKQMLSDWQVGSAMIGNRNVEVLQGSTPEGLPVRLYFDAKSGLLVRLVRYTDSVLGRNASQIDYSDYRPVAGVEMPFHWVQSWLDGKSTFDLSSVRPNVPIDAARFGQPVQVEKPAKAAATK